jgi:hypothetical protein
MALVQLDLIPGRGDQLLTFDSDTGLEWLNLTATANMSYLEVLGGAGGFIGSFGFRYGAGGQVATLFKHAGVSKLGGPTPAVDNANHYGILVLQDLMNGKRMVPVSSPGSVSVDTQGMVKYTGTGTPSLASPIDIWVTHLNHFEPNKSYTDSGGAPQRADKRSALVGSYLVRKRPY